MAYVLDIAVILILGSAIFFGAKKGFVESTIGLVSMVLAVSAAFLLNGPLANLTYTSFIQTKMESTIETRINETAAASGINGTTSAPDGDTANYLAAAEEGLPSFVRSLLDKYGVSLAETDVSVAETLESTAHTVAVAVTEQVVKPLVLLLLRCIIALLLLIVLLLLLTWLGKMIAKLIRLTPLKKTDSVFGGILGALKGAVWVLLAVTLVQTVTAFTAPDAWLSQATVENSILVSRIAAINPLYEGSAALLAQITNLF